MSDLPERISELQMYFNQRKYIEQAALQFLKDFRMNDEAIANESLPAVFSELISLITPIVSQLMKRNPTRLKGILYAVDIPEKALGRALSDSDPASKLSILIAERELMKVVFRHHHNNPEIK